MPITNGPLMAKSLYAFSRAAKGSRNPSRLQRAVRTRDRIWGPLLVDRMIAVAQAVLADLDADLSPFLDDIRQTRRDQVKREGLALAAIAQGADDPLSPASQHLLRIGSGGLVPVGYSASARRSR